MADDDTEKAGLPDDTESSRRDVLKVTGSVTAAGAMGALAGCTGDGGGGDTATPTEGGGGDQTAPPIGGTDTPTEGGDGMSPTETETPTEGGGQESVSIQFLSAEAAENSLTKPQYKESLGWFEEENPNISVTLQTASYGDIKSKLSSTVSAGDPPTLAESGSLGLALFLDDKVPSHDPYVEASDLYPDKWSAASKSTANFRGTYWCGGPPRHSVSNLGIRPKMFSQAGVSDPMSELATWSGFGEALEAVGEEFPDAFPFEQTGVYNDLESYWGECRTAHTGGKDPWIRGSGTSPDVQIGSNDRTDGVIEDTVMRANRFSSESSPKRADEEIPSLMLTGKVGSFTYMTQNFTRWTQIKKNAKIGWQGGDGDVMLLPNPKVDPDYGDKFDWSSDTLAGIEGQHGGHVWALEQAQNLFKKSQAKMDAGWKLNTFLHREKRHIIQEYGQVYPSIPADTDMMQVLLNELGGQLPQNFTQVLKNLGEYGSQYNNTGAPWDVKGTDKIRWTDMNKTISQSIAGQIPVDNLVSEVESRVNKTLENQNT